MADLQHNPPKEKTIKVPTPLERIAQMNTAFGNPAGDFTKIEARILLRQCRNIFDEYLELLAAFGVSKLELSTLTHVHDEIMVMASADPGEMNVEEVRDALCDIQVFAGGAQHLMGVDPDADMHAVINGVMSRFIKDEQDKEGTIALHSAKGVTDVYFEGEYPRMVMKSASDQPDAPKGKFLKSASYSKTVFPDPANIAYARGLGANVVQAMMYDTSAQIVAADSSGSKQAYLVVEDDLFLCGVCDKLQSPVGCLSLSGLTTRREKARQMRALSFRIWFQFQVD